MKLQRYYREYLSSWGSGVMLAYDTVMAYSVAEASIQKPAGGMYAYDESFECIEKVKKEHLDLNDHELSKIYGAEEG